MLSDCYEEAEDIGVMTHIVGVLALDGVVPADLATPCAVFDRVEKADGLPFYDVRVCAEAPEVQAGVPPRTGSARHSSPRATPPST